MYISTSGGDGSLLAVRILPPNGGKAGPGKGNHEALDRGERSPVALGLLAEGPGWRSHPSSEGWAGALCHTDFLSSRAAYPKCPGDTSRLFRDAIPARPSYLAATAFTPALESSSANFEEISESRSSDRRVSWEPWASSAARASY